MPHCKSSPIFSPSDSHPFIRHALPHSRAAFMSATNRTRNWARSCRRCMFPAHLCNPGQSGDAFDYTRSGNPTRKAFETTLANLEAGFGGLAFAWACGNALRGDVKALRRRSYYRRFGYLRRHLSAAAQDRQPLGHYGFAREHLGCQCFRCHWLRRAGSAKRSNAKGVVHPRFGPLPGGEGVIGLAAIESAITPNTKLLWIESPGNPQLSITDIAARNS